MQDKGINVLFVNIGSNDGGEWLNLLCLIYRLAAEKCHVLFLDYLLLLLPLISMMTTNWESRRWWFLMGVFIYKLYEFSNRYKWKEVSR